MIPKALGLVWHEIKLEPTTRPSDILTTKHMTHALQFRWHAKTHLTLSKSCHVLKKTPPQKMQLEATRNTEPVCGSELQEHLAVAPTLPPTIDAVNSFLLSCGRFWWERHCIRWPQLPPPCGQVGALNYISKYRYVYIIYDIFNDIISTKNVQYTYVNFQILD